MSLDDLRAALDDVEPDGFDAADPADLADLADAIVDARRRHDRELAEASGQALDHVPRLLQGPVKRVLGL